MKNLQFLNISIHKNFYQKKCENDFRKTMVLYNLQWSLRSCFNLLKNLCLYYVSIHTNFYQNLLINERELKNFIKIRKVHMDIRSFFVRHKRKMHLTYFMLKLTKKPRGWGMTFKLVNNTPTYNQKVQFFHLLFKGPPYKYKVGATLFLYQDIYHNLTFYEQHYTDKQ